MTASPNSTLPANPNWTLEDLRDLASAQHAQWQQRGAVPVSLWDSVKVLVQADGRCKLAHTTPLSRESPLLMPGATLPGASAESVAASPVSVRESACRSTLTRGKSLEAGARCRSSKAITQVPSPPALMPDHLRLSVRSFSPAGAQGS